MVSKNLKPFHKIYVQYQTKWLFCGISRLCASTSRTLSYLNDSAFLNELFLGNEKLNKLLTRLPVKGKQNLILLVFVF